MKMLVQKRDFLGNLLTLDGYSSILYIKVTLRWIDKHFHPNWLLFVESTKFIYFLSYNSLMFDQISLFL